MNSKCVGALVIGLGFVAAITGIAAAKSDLKLTDGVYRLKSHGQVVAEFRVVAPDAKMELSSVNDAKMELNMAVGGGRTTWRAGNASKSVTARLLVGGASPVEFTAEEIELDREVNADPKKSPESK